MATPLTKPRQSNTIALSQAKRSNANGNDGLSPDPYQDIRLKLLSVLQSTLDLEQLLLILFNELQVITDLNGLSYFEESRQLDLSNGKKARHSCGYRVITQEDHLGEICFYNSKRFSEQDLELIEIVLGVLVCPLRNALNYRDALVASLTDPLTGAGNRIALRDTLTREIELARRHDSDLAVLMIDLDNFKQVNDKHGHIVGDLVLKKLVNALRLANRQTDLSFRYGGEEFMVLLNKTDLQGAKVIGDRIRKVVEELDINLTEDTLQVTVSIGATAQIANDDMESLLKRADAALYQAKDAGKNCVVGL